MGWVMSEAGIQFIPAYTALKDGVVFDMSLEVLPDWDADFLFVVLYSHGSLEDLEPVFKQPLWSTLKAVQNEQVYIVSENPTGGSIAAIQLIDDLSEYFSSKL